MTSILSIPSNNYLRSDPTIYESYDYETDSLCSYQSDDSFDYELEFQLQPALVPASSENGSGPVNREEVNKYFEILQNRASKGVIFSREYLEDSCYGGTCSAQSLNFASRFVSLPGKMPLDERVLTAASQCTKSSLELRTQQAALNAIAKDPEISVKDFKKAKVQSIVALRDFEVVKSVNLFKKIECIYQNGGVPTSNQTIQCFKQAIQNLEPGLYFCRLLAEAENYKDEYFGHSVIFIKGSSDNSYLWDPAGGLYNIDQRFLGIASYMSFVDITDRWLLNEPRFYLIEKKSPKHSFKHCVKRIISLFRFNMKS